MIRGKRNRTMLEPWLIAIAFCQQNFSSEQQAKTVGASLGYKELDIGYNQAAQSWLEFRSSYCQDTGFKADFKTKTRTFVKRINKDVIQAMSACFDAPGFHARIEQGSDIHTFFISARYQGDVEPVSKVQVSTLIVHGGTCKGSDLKKGAWVGSSTRQILCTRKGDEAVDVVLTAQANTIWTTPQGLPPILNPILKEPPPSSTSPARITIKAATEYEASSSVNVKRGGPPPACTPNPDFLLNGVEGCGKAANAAEFLFEAKAAGTYRLEVFYAAASSRPVKIVLNGTTIDENGLKDPTGSWDRVDEAKPYVATVRLLRGQNVLRLSRGDVFPHIRDIIFTPVAVTGQSVTSFSN